jgi:acyl-CoA thioesterase
MAEDAQSVAERAVAELWAPDRATQGLGMQIVKVAPGAVSISMTIREDMANGHGICHGGFIFTLADSAFAFSCNSAGEATVAASAQIEFLEAVRVGERLTAAGRMLWERGRQGIYAVDVCLEDGTLVALFRGRSHKISRSAS